MSGGKARAKVTVSKESDAELLESGARHFENVYSRSVHPFEPIPADPVIPPVEINDGPFTLDELQAAVKKMKKDKCCGLDEMTVDALHLPHAQRCVLDVLNGILDGDPPPQELRETLLVPVYKKGPADKWKNCRPIALMSSTTKLLDSMILERIRTVIDPFLSGSQNGFRKERDAAIISWPSADGLKRSL